ncbi:aquaporin-like [Convolutriloba macropyga]|uniref:aquaporin-like n=1 Tax=Convolutriloba macropyga TaxID=536237 RepID=UPI003F5224C5
MSLFKEVLCEFFGTFMLMFIGLGSVLPAAVLPDIDNLIVPAICFFAVVATLIHLIGPTSGCHINPAVTLAIVLMGRIHPVHAFLYFIAQVVGAVLGTAHLYWLSPPEWVEAASLGMTKVHPSLTVYQAVVWEVTITTLLILTVLLLTQSLSTPNANIQYEGVPAITAATAVVACIFSGGGFTGASLNPARSFGPALIMMDFKDQWVYWVGPLGASVVSAVIYKYLLEEGIIKSQSGRNVSSNEPEKPREQEMKEKRGKKDKGDKSQPTKTSTKYNTAANSVELNLTNESTKA